MSLSRDIADADVVRSFEVDPGKLHIYHGSFEGEQWVQDKASKEASEAMMAGGIVTWDDGIIEYYRIIPVVEGDSFIWAQDQKRIRHTRVLCRQSPEGKSETVLPDVFILPKWRTYQGIILPPDHEEEVA